MVDGDILITTIQVNFVLISIEAGMKQHKMTWIVIKILPSAYTITAISLLSLWFNSLWAGPQLIFFYSQAVFELVIFRVTVVW